MRSRVLIAVAVVAILMIGLGAMWSAEDDDAGPAAAPVAEVPSQAGDDAVDVEQDGIEPQDPSVTEADSVEQEPALPAPNP